MSFEGLKLETLKTMEKSLDDFYKSYKDALAKKKKTEAERLKKEIETKAVSIKKALDAVGMTYVRNHKAYGKTIDDYLAAGEAVVKEAKANLEAFRKSAHADKLGMVYLAPNELKKVEARYEDEEQAFRTAQMPLRGKINVKEVLVELFGTKYTKDFDKMRQGTIDENNKTYQPKLSKAAGLKLVLDALIKQADALKAGMAQGQGDKRTGATASLDKTKEIIKDLVQQIQKLQADGVGSKVSIDKARKDIKRNVDEITKLIKDHGRSPVESKTKDELKLKLSVVDLKVEAIRADLETMKHVVSVHMGQIPAAQRKDKLVATSVTQVEMKIKSAEADLAFSQTQQKQIKSAARDFLKRGQA